MRGLYTTITAIFILMIVIGTTNNGICSQSLQTPDKTICVADIHSIFQQSDAEKDAKSELEFKQQEMGTTLDKIGKEIDTLNESLQRESMVMNKKVIAERERELRIKVNDLKLLKIRFQEELDALQQKLVSDIEKDILDIISEVGKSEGYSLVVNKSAVLYSDNVIDITDRILNMYNAEYGKKK